MQRLMYLSVSILCLSLALLIGFHLGLEQVSAAKPVKITPSDVAVLSGVLNDGDTIPLPTYSDGTTAVESDCYWTVSLHEMMWPHSPLDRWIIEAPNRVVTVRTQDINSGEVAGYTTGSANYLIVAVRDAGTIRETLASEPATWGQLKTKYPDKP